MKTMAEVLEELDKHRPDHREYEGGWWELACAGCDFAKGHRLSHLDWAPYRIHRAEVFAAALSAAGFGPVREAQAEALRDAAEALERVDRIAATPINQVTPEEEAEYMEFANSNGDKNWLRERAANLATP